MLFYHSLPLFVLFGGTYASFNDFGIPPSNATVDVKVFNPGNITIVNASDLFISPILPGHETTAGVLTDAICSLNFVIAEHSSGYLWIAEALRAGLLSVGETVHRQLEFYVTSLMPAPMVYRSVVKALNDVYRDIEDLASNRQPSLFNDWRVMTTLTRECVDLLDDEEEMEYCTPFKGMQNERGFPIHCG
ncbi:hypothetical protein C8R44DRAFT_881928 [Mycena epipterygia]|nr:hypothetical protein C8R44DRAFT_881928 [Mycena epipterygia]